jgi:UrcA family protein
MKGLYSTRLATCLAAAALATAGLTLAADSAFAQQTEQIIVVAPLDIVGQEDRTPNRIYLTQWVGFSDLDLRTDWGVRTLGARIGYAAEENCKLLDRYYPDSMPVAAKVNRKQNCVSDAVYGTEPQLRAVIIAARQ